MERCKKQVASGFFMLLLAGYPLPAISGSSGMNALQVNSQLIANSDRFMSRFNIIISDSLPPVSAFAQSKDMAVCFLTLNAAATYQAVGIDTVISLYPKKGVTANSDLPVQELYRGKKLNIDFHHNKTENKLVLIAEEPMLNLVIYNEKAEEIYSAVLANTRHSVPLVAYKNGRYSVLVTCTRSRFAQFFFNKAD